MPLDSRQGRNSHELRANDSFALAPLWVGSRHDGPSRAHFILKEAATRDAWDIASCLRSLKPFSGHNMWRFRAIDATIMVSTAAILGSAASRLSTPNYGPSAALGFLLLFSSNGWFFTAQPDGWVAAAATFAIAPYLNTNKHPTLFQAWLSGFMVSLAALIKPLYIIFVLSPAAAIALQDQRTPSERLQHWLMLAFGLSAPIIAVLLLYVDQNALASLIEVHILYPMKSYSDVGQLSFATIAIKLRIPPQRATDTTCDAGRNFTRCRNLELETSLDPGISY